MNIFLAGVGGCTIQPTAVGMVWKRERTLMRKKGALMEEYLEGSNPELKLLPDFTAKQH